MLRKLTAGSLVLACLMALVIAQHKLAHFSLPLHDASQNRDVPVEAWSTYATLAKAQLGVAPRFAIINHGNTVRHNEYQGIARVLAGHGYIVGSIQHDLPHDPPLSLRGYPYVGRLPVYQRGVKNILFTVAELKQRFPQADVSKIMLVGHSNGGDIAVYFASEHPDFVERIVTLDNLRVPLTLASDIPILSIRSNDWKADEGVVPHDAECEKLGIHLVKTNFQHVELSDRGPEFVKQHVAAALKRFLAEPLRPRPQGKIMLVQHIRE